MLVDDQLIGGVHVVFFDATDAASLSAAQNRITHYLTTANLRIPLDQFGVPVLLTAVLPQSLFQQQMGNYGALQCISPNDMGGCDAWNWPVVNTLAAPIVSYDGGYDFATHTMYGSQLPNYVSSNTASITRTVGQIQADAASLQQWIDYNNQLAAQQIAASGGTTATSAAPQLAIASVQWI